MNSMSRILALLAASSVIGVSIAQAEGFKDRGRCTGSSFSTCASAEATMVGHEVWFRWPNAFGGSGMARHAFRFGDGPDGSRPPSVPGHDGPLVTPCPTGGDRPHTQGECTLPTTVTPEPVSMALIATGLVGIMGASRRKKPNRAL